MIKKLLPKSPLGIAFFTITAILTLSPEARRLVRTTAVKGLASIMSLTDQVKGMTSNTQNLLPASSESNPVFTYDTNVEPAEYTEKNMDSGSAFNVLNDNYLQSQFTEIKNELH
ncbi:hypothetical protein [Aneurinibacillus terranovensis]|uniref:hypothetical protein n=1 Tax=Aneurinibacillus terranovensis TaxID=278991 RepID=UPI0004081DE5|nr:hypothetical protein [Aneurinibacillus terranovensis]